MTGDLRAAVAVQGLLYPPDPRSVAFCRLGGNVATGAGGMCCEIWGSAVSWRRWRSCSPTGESCGPAPAPSRVSRGTT
ncbi:FAD-binding protein [Nocardia grenadensis]|uniref:FAD-binding protein n=1 Tax=Nocardia grenadensis TaxID=931537 RepID=UPI001FE17BE5|nr:FAD-binding protein [Nocardia grenadensis]